MFLETIHIQQGEVLNIAYHRKRMTETAAFAGFTAPEIPDLTALCPAPLRDKNVKCRIIYRDKIESIDFEIYVPRQLSSLKLVTCNDIDYDYKYVDRQYLNELSAQKGNCDEILIVKNGYITDTSFSNVVFEKDGAFLTPDTYLLNGTKRQCLLENGIIAETKIRVEDISSYERVYLINAMLDINDTQGIAVSEIH